MSADCPTSARASPWPVLHVQQGRVPILGFTPLGRKFRAASLPDEALNESWKVHTMLHTQVFHAPVVCSLPSYEQQHHNLLEIRRGTCLARSAGIHRFSRSNLEFVITAAHRHTLLTKEVLGAFLEVFFERSPFLTTDPHTSPHLRTLERCNVFFWHVCQAEESFLQAFPFNPQGFLFPNCFYLLHGLKVKDPTRNLYAHPTHSGAKRHCLTTRLRWVVGFQAKHRDLAFLPRQTIKILLKTSKCEAVLIIFPRFLCFLSDVPMCPQHYSHFLPASSLKKIKFLFPAPWGYLSFAAQLTLYFNLLCVLSTSSKFSYLFLKSLKA